MSKVGSSDKPGDDKKYLLAKKVLDNVTKSPEGSDINTYICRDKKTNEVISGHTTWHKDLFGKKVKLDTTKKYYHCTNADGLKELKPQFISKSNTSSFDDEEGSGKSVYFYPNKRIYITDSKPDKNFGKHGYELLDIPAEGYPNRIGYYIEPRGPIRVKQIF